MMQTWKAGLTTLTLVAFGNMGGLGTPENLGNVGNVQKGNRVTREAFGNVSGTPV